MLCIYVKQRTDLLYVYLGYTKFFIFFFFKFIVASFTMFHDTIRKIMENMNVALSPLRDLNAILLCRLGNIQYYVKTVHKHNNDS